MSVFDSLERTELQRRLALRVVDGALRRLIGQGVHVGVRDGEAYGAPAWGTAQGAGLSPLWGNVSLH